MEQNNSQGFEPMGTKIHPDMAKVWDAVCQALGTDTYHMLQHFIYAMIRMASDSHQRTPEVEKLMTILETDVAWQNAINLCAPTGKQSIAQMILIVEQEGKKGFGMYMLDKPYMQECKQTECVDDILERVIEVGIKGLYKKLVRMGVDMRCNSFLEVILAMLDEQDLLNTEQADRSEMMGQANFSDYGKAIEYGKKNKQLKHRTPDGEANRQQRIVFDEGDANTAEREVHDFQGQYRYDPKEAEGEHRGNADDGIEYKDFRPFDVEP